MSYGRQSRREKRPDPFAEEFGEEEGNERRSEEPGRFPYVALGLLGLLGFMLVIKLLFELTFWDFGGYWVLVPAAFILLLVARMTVRR